MRYECTHPRARERGAGGTYHPVRIEVIAEGGPYAAQLFLTQYEPEDGAPPALRELPGGPAAATPWWVGVDWQQLREQKLALVGLAMSLESGDAGPALAKNADHVAGIVNLLDVLMDQAAEVLGERTVFGDLTGGPDAVLS